MGLYDIDITELTDNVVISSDNEVSGSGIFDTLMVTVSKHIEAQYREGRILGTEYSNVYLGALQAVLDLSTKILLEKDLIAKQAEEVDSRINVNSKQIEKLTSDITISEEQSTKDLLLKDKQIEKLTSDISIAEAQSEKDLLLKDEQISKLSYEIANLLPAQKELIAKQADEIGIKITDIIPEQKALIEAQTINEGKKGSLIDYQRHGFKVDATHKNVKTLLDTWSIYYSMTPDGDNLLENLKKPTIDNTINALSTVIDQFPTIEEG